MVYALNFNSHIIQIGDWSRGPFSLQSPTLPSEALVEEMAFYKSYQCRKFFIVRHSHKTLFEIPIRFDVVIILQWDSPSMLCHHLYWWLLYLIKKVLVNSIPVSYYLKFQFAKWRVANLSNIFFKISKSEMSIHFIVN